MKRVLIITLYFPPTNAADMQRIRISLPYFKQFGWEAEVVTIDPQYSDLPKDELLLKSIDKHTTIHYVKAFSKGITSKFGLGSIALRSLYFYKKEVNKLLKSNKYDLIYFSTTQFPVCILGAYWNRKFNIPFVIDMQDPWHSDYYQDKPKIQRPKKYWFSYRLSKYLEPVAMKQAGGLISVSENYITDLVARYPRLQNVPKATIPFGAFKPDMEIALANQEFFTSLLSIDFKNLVYIGRGGMDMHAAITPLFEALNNGLLQQPEIFKKIRIYFIGTSYAPTGQGVKTIEPLAKQYDLSDQVVEITDRISYYHTLTTLQQSDALFMPGSDDPNYSASKIYPYLLTNKPLLAIINSQSPANNILHEYRAVNVYNYDSNDVTVKTHNFLTELLTNKLSIPQYDTNAEEKYSAHNLTHKQCDVFDAVINYNIP